MSLSRRLAPALLLAASAVLPLAYAQDCNPDDQIWDSVRPSIDPSVGSLINRTAHAGTNQKSYLDNLLQYQAVREASSAFISSTSILSFSLTSF